MKSAASVTIDPSQFPDAVRRDLLASLRSRRVNPKFHYDTVKQAQKWLALHEAHSPARHDADCLAAYDRAFVETASQIKAGQVHVIGLGCGGGQKDARLLQRLKARGRKISYTPCDVSVALALTARKAALKILPGQDCLPFVCDLATAKDLPAALANQSAAKAVRLITFFGMIPNFEPQEILPKLASLVRQRDFLLFSANLAPGGSYVGGLKKILPQYDNALTRDWLLTFLFDLGMTQRDGRLVFSVETGGLGLKRIVAKFHFSRAVRIGLDGEEFGFRRGESLRLFFSYRYTPDRTRKTLAKFGLQICGQWLAKSEEEGVFLVRRR